MTRVARPILFSGPMIRALLDGRKTQTRRICKLPEDAREVRYYAPPSGRSQLGWADPGVNWWNDRGNHIYPCPYGQQADLLWVRESFRMEVRGNRNTGEKFDVVMYRANSPWRPEFDALKYKPSIHMPRSASRLTLELSEIRVQRLQDISEGDAIAEGIERIDDPRGVAWKSYETILEGRHKGKPHPHSAAPNRSPVTSYRELWEGINGKGSWEANPYVWALTFSVLKRNVDDVLREVA